MSIERLIRNWPKFRDTDIPYAEVVQGPRSPEEEFRDDGSRAVRTYYIPWQRRQEFRNACLAWAVVKQGDQAGKKYIARHTPHAYPESANSTGKPDLFASQIIRMEPWGIPDDTSLIGMRVRQPDGTVCARYGLAKVQVLYESLDYEVKEDSELANDPNTGLPDESGMLRYVTILPNPSGRGIGIPVGLLQYVDNNAAAQPVGSGGLKEEVSYDVEVLWRRVPKEAIGMRFTNPDAPVFQIEKALSKLNKTTFLGCEPGTLLLKAVCPRPIRSGVGDRIYDVSFRFKYFSPVDANALPAGQTVTHNHVFNVVGPKRLGRYTEVRFLGEAGVDDALPLTSNLVAQKDGISMFQYYELRNCFRVPRTGM